MARTSARSSATRDQASSPPKQFNDRQSQSPVGRRTRSTRSRSADLGESEMPTTTRRGGKRGARQSSIESIESDASAASSRASRTRKPTRAAAAGARDLSMVVEDREREGNEDEEEEEEDVDLDGEAEDGAARAQRSRSPGGMSQISGTTAISSFSARTSHSQAEIGALDPIVAEMLGDLWDDSDSIMRLLALEATSEEKVESNVKELKISGSRLAKKLKQKEKRFDGTRELYGSEPYIKPAIIYERLLRSPDPAEGDFRPDAILHAANLASLVKDFLVMEKESQSSQSILGGLDSFFPQAFLSRFADNIKYGNSRLLDQSFELAVDIRTQLTMVALRLQKDQDSWDPDQILLGTFYDSLLRPIPPLSEFENTLQNERPRALMGADLELTDNQIAQVVQRVSDIRSAFRQSNDAIEAGDLVDFEQLEENFPWTAFLTDLIAWSRERWIEISKGNELQGGVNNIIRSFIDIIKNNDSQVDINYDPPPPPSITAPRQLQPPAEIVPGTSGQSLYNGDRDMVRLLGQYKRTSSSHEAPRPTQQKASAASSSAPPAKSLHQGTSRSKPFKATVEVSDQDFVDGLPAGADDYDQEPRPVKEYVDAFTAHQNEGNKENRPAPKRRLVDPQPGAHQVQWEDSQDGEAGPSTNKRKYEEPVEEEQEEERAEGEQQEEDDEEEEVSEDEGFQVDERIANPALRTAARTAGRQSPVQDAPSPSKRRAIERPGANANREAVGPWRQRGESSARSNARRAVEEDEDENEDEDHPPPTFPQASLAAKVNYEQSRARMDREPQRRVPWSEEDTLSLQNAIEEFGCSWSLIHKRVEFDHPRDQVAIKDKARNMKVTYLKARLVLPLNFDNIPLGKKEIESVRRIIPDYEP